ncbi:MAG TPA: DUF3014 domain-containing protein [Myxococcales bacterium]|nr:DUF3014 domain-containing protein [Myxococcales bacterium]
MDNEFDRGDPKPATAQRGPGAIIAIAIVVVVLAAAAWFALHRAPDAPPPAPVAAQGADAGLPGAAQDAPLPSVAEGDARVRAIFGPLSTRPEWTAWLSTANLLERASVLLDNLVLDVSPRKQLAFLAPALPFSAAGRGAKLSIDPKSYARYDTIADVVASIDAKGFARAVRTLYPLLQTAYHGLGYPDRPLDPVLSLALKRIIEAPVANGEVALRKEGGIYRFQDQKLEESGDVEKHLLRMGPRNTLLVQGKAREIAAALALPVP